NSATPRSVRAKRMKSTGMPHIAGSSGAAANAVAGAMNARQSNAKRVTRTMDTMIPRDAGSSQSAILPSRTARPLIPGSGHDEDVDPIRSMRAEHDGLLDIPRSRRAGDEIDRPRDRAELVADQRAGFFHSAHDARAPYDGDVGVGQKRGRGGRVAARHDDQRTGLGNGAEDPRDAKPVLPAGGPRFDLQA